MTTPEVRVTSNLGDLDSNIVKLDIEVLGKVISDLIIDVGQLHFVTSGDLRVYGPAVNSAPTSVEMAMKYGTKFFDAVYYLACDPKKRPATIQGTALAEKFAEELILTKRRLMWTAIFLMLRGSYPKSGGTTVGTDVPAFLVNTAGMSESPAATAAGLASFDLSCIPTGWIRYIPWHLFAPEIKQRLALGLAGYRSLGPFKIEPCRADAPQEVVEAYEWVRAIASQPPDYQILSATRSAKLISQLGSWNKALANLSLLCFTDVQLDEMVANKILFKKPVRDARADTWRTWAANVKIELNDPIKLDDTKDKEAA